MKPREYSTLGLIVAIACPESVDEFDQNAGRPGACLEEGTNNIVYRSWLAEFRHCFLHGRPATDDAPAIQGIEALTGIARNAKKNDKGEVEKYLESEAVYFKRVCETREVDPESFQDLANTITATIPFDASKAERQAPEPKKIAKEYYQAADAIIGKGENIAAQVAAKLTELLQAKTPYTADRESLAKAISDNEARLRAEAKKQVAGKLLALVS